jgi:hypothetical protein
MKMGARRNKEEEKVEYRSKNRKKGRGSKCEEKGDDTREEKRSYWVQCVAPISLWPFMGPCPQI